MINKPDNAELTKTSRLVNSYCPFRRSLSLALIAGLTLLLSANSSAALDINQYPELQKVVDDLAGKGNYPREELIAVLQSAEVSQKTIDLMNKQYEALPWHRYREIFINEARISKGVEFWKENLDTLNAAEDKYGVAPAVIVALIGVETHYGTRMGNRRVLDSLVTLTADFPRRTKFFGKELRTFLLTTRRESIPADSVMGSYAGAIGYPSLCQRATKRTPSILMATVDVILSMKWKMRLAV